MERRGEPAAHKDLLVPEDCGSGAVCLLHRKLKGQGVKGELKAISHTHTRSVMSPVVCLCVRSSLCRQSYSKLQFVCLDNQLTSGVLYRHVCINKQQ